MGGLRHRGAMVTIGEPLSRASEPLLRRLVLEHKATERRHRFSPVLHLGWPGRQELGRVVDPAPPYEVLDDALRSDLLSAMLRRAPDGPVMAWLTRPADIEVQDVDLAWLRAVTTVLGETGRLLPYVVVTRTGWRDPLTGVGRSWRRLRER